MRIVAPMQQAGGPRIPQNPIFLKNGKNHPKRKNSNLSRNMPKLAIGSKKKLTFFARRFQTIFKQKCSYLRPLLSITFPQGFRISRNIGHPTLGSGGKKTFKWFLKSEHTDGQTDGRTDRQTDRQTDRRTFRLIESIGPEGRCFEKCQKSQLNIGVQEGLH